MSELPSPVRTRARRRWGERALLVSIRWGVVQELLCSLLSAAARPSGGIRTDPGVGTGSRHE